VTHAPATEARLPEGDDKHHAVEAMFDRIAPRYDRLNRIISLGQDRRWRRHTVAALRLAPGATVLDLGCGTGDLCDVVAAAGYSATGVDFSAGMLAAAHTRAPLARADALALPVPDASTDGIVSGFALRNFVDLDRFFRECARVLRAGGVFVHVGVHPCFCGGFADRSVSAAVGTSVVSITVRVERNGPLFGNRWCAWLFGLRVCSSLSVRVSVI